MNNLAKYRTKHKFTQTELGNKIGVSKAGLSYIEKNRINPNTAAKCAEILNENMFSILGKDALRAIPKTEEDKDVLINLIRGL